MFEIFEMYFIIVYSIYIYIYIYTYIVCWDVFLFFGYHTSHTSQFSLFSLSRVCIADLRTQGFLSENCGFGGPLASEITAFGGMLSFWSNLKHSFWSSTSTGTAAAELQDDTTASFSEKRHAEKSKKKNTTLDEDGQAF